MTGMLSQLKNDPCQSEGQLVSKLFSQGCHSTALQTACLNTPHVNPATQGCMSFDLVVVAVCNTT